MKFSNFLRVESNFLQINLFLSDLFSIWYLKFLLMTFFTSKSKKISLKALGKNKKTHLVKMNLKNKRINLLEKMTVEMKNDKRY